MEALVIGGTRFVGAAIVEELSRRGARVTVFSRGQTNPERFAEHDHVRGDRARDLDRLGERRFDAVFDTCGYLPEVVAASAARFAGSDAFYAFISSASAYAASSAPSLTESSPLAAVDPGAPIEDPANYGAAKVGCEQTLTASLGDRLAVLRAGLIVGPGDYTDRFPYWVARLDRPGPVLCPGDGTDPAQLIDARDLAAFAVDLAGSRTAGVFNVSGPETAATFADLIAAIAPSRRDLVWAPSDFLAAHQVSPWADMPCWLPRDHEAAAILRLDLGRAAAAGLRLRPWSDTAADTRSHLAGRDLPFACGLSPERERDLIASTSRQG